MRPFHQPGHLIQAPSRPSQSHQPAGAGPRVQAQSALLLVSLGWNVLKTISMREPYEPLGSAKGNEEWHPDHLQEIVDPTLFQKHASDLQHRSSALSLSLAFSIHLFVMKEGYLLPRQWTPGDLWAVLAFLIQLLALQTNRPLF